MSKPNDNLEEEAIIGTLAVVAGALAPIVPVGTVAAAVIAAGIGIYQITKQIDDAQQAADEKLYKMDAIISAKKSENDAVTRALKRPVMPLDVYSGPPMYWIVDSLPTNTGEQRYYNIPNGKVDWPCTTLIGGRTLMDGKNQENIDLDFVYAATPPSKNSIPSMCVFFWAVPIFFARLHQLLGEAMFGKGFSPSESSGHTDDNGKKLTQKESAFNEITKILKEGRLDNAGNWYGKIGPTVSALSSDDDDDYAPRYYGRSAWVHNLAMQNIKYSDGTRMYWSGIPDCNGQSGKDNKDTYLSIGNYASSAWTKNQIDLSAIAEKIGPKFSAGPTYTAFDYTTGSYRAESIVQNSGHVFDLRALLSKYNIDDPYFTQKRDSKDLNENWLYYVVVSVVGADTTTIRTFNWGTKYWEANQGSVYNYITYDKVATKHSLTPSGYVQAIGDAGGWKRMIVDKLGIPDLHYPRHKASIWHGSFSLAPFSLFIEPEIAAAGGNSPPRPKINTKSSSYVFIDFDPVDRQNYPGLYFNGVGKTDFNWLRRLALMPSIVEGQEKAPWDSSVNPTGYLSYWTWPYDGGVGGQHPVIKLVTTRYYTFNPTLHKKSNGTLPDIQEIIKVRPPIAADFHQTVILTEEYWGEASWAHSMAKSDPSLKTKGIAFATTKTFVEPGYKLVIFPFQKTPFSKFSSDQEKPVTSAYYRTFVDENKPIVQVPGHEYPSPFYCGRRADARLLPAFKAVRAAQLGLDKCPGSGWEDCHEWSWPYNNALLINLGDVSRNLYKKHGEGLGRAGLSPSCIATGPTLWGDLSLYGKIYNSLISGPSSKPNTKSFETVIAISIWTAITEVQSGSYLRYSRSTGSPTGKTLATKTGPFFARYADDKSSYNTFLLDAKEAEAKDKSKPNIWSESKGKLVKITPEQYASLCMQIIDAWYNGTFPVPTDSYQKSFDKNFDSNLIEQVCDAHIRLKNWAIDLGRPEHEKIGHAFPSDKFSINFAGLNKANQVAIQAYNAQINSEIAQTNPLELINSMLNSEHAPIPEIPSESDIPKSPGMSTNKKIAIGAAVATALAVAVAITAVSRKE